MLLNRLVKAIIKSTPLLAVLFLLYFGFWWIYKLDILPGLHGDEAWVGLKATEFKQKGIDHLYGMNTYTGILQPILTWLVFKVFNIGVSQLRAGSIAFNLLALVIISLTFYLNRLKRILHIFLLIVAQSALYLISPRVAWEVNTFTLFFISLLIVSAFKIIKHLNNPKGAWMLLFLITNILGTYNHVLFSCVSISALVGILLWSFYSESLYYKNLIILLIINMVNLILVFMGMRYWPDVPFFKEPFIIGPLIILLLFAELRLFTFLTKVFINRIIKINPVIIRAILIAGCISFAIYHGMALLQVLSSFKLLIHAYSYQPGIFTQMLFLTGGCIFAAYLLYFLLSDVTDKTSISSVFAFIVIAYWGLLPFYTTNCSFRYYLAIYAIIGLYISMKASQGRFRSVPLIISLTMMFCLLNMVLFNVFFSTSRPIKALELTVGNGNIETSAHFLPNKPLIEFLKKNQIGGITYLSNQYFLEQPILFYKLIEPWKESPANKAIIDYNYDSYKGGYMLYKLK